MEGHGELNWIDANSNQINKKYIGAFENNQRHGFGEMVWTDQKGNTRQFKGQWINGKPQTEGFLLQII